VPLGHHGDIDGGWIEDDAVVRRDCADVLERSAVCAFRRGNALDPSKGACTPISGTGSAESGRHAAADAPRRFR
jgi:hypothetical protein